MCNAPPQRLGIRVNLGFKSFYIFIFAEFIWQKKILLAKNEAKVAFLSYCTLTYLNCNTICYYMI